MCDHCDLLFCVASYIVKLLSPHYYLYHSGKKKEEISEPAPGLLKQTVWMVIVHVALHILAIGIHCQFTSK